MGENLVKDLPRVGWPVHVFQRALLHFKPKDIIGLSDSYIGALDHSEFLYTISQVFQFQGWIFHVELNICDIQNRKIIVVPLNDLMSFFSDLGFKLFWLVHVAWPSFDMDICDQVAWRFRENALHVGHNRFRYFICTE